MCGKGLEAGDVAVNYRSVLFRGEKAFLESASWEGVLEKTQAGAELESQNRDRLLIVLKSQ